MNKEIAVRRRIQGIFNKREEDFASLRHYNDYLEEVEDTIFGLIEGVDVARIEEKIARYQEENAEAILASRARRAEEQAAALRAEKQQRLPAAAAAAASGEAAATVVAQQQNSSAASSQAPLAASGQYAPAMFLQPRPSGQPVPLGAPSSLLNGNGEPEDEESRQLREERGVKAGGWTPELGRRRAYEEAFNSIWVN